jgi:hypothetical protein
MSCETKNGQAAKCAATAGVSKPASKGAQVTGMFNAALKKTGQWGQAAVDQAYERRAKVDQMIAPVADKALTAMNTANQYNVDSIGSALVLNKIKKTALGVPLKTLLMYAGVSKRATSLVTNKVEGLSREKAVQTIIADKPVLYFFKRKIAVTCWQSGMTPVLNRMDTAGFKKEDVVSSKGISMSFKGTTWHRGISMVKTPGGNRTITHLQSLTFPAKHYYFDRPLSPKETVGIVSGQSGYYPTSMNGFIGQIGEGEQLAIPWSQAKSQLIRSRILHPPQGTEPNSPPPRRPPGYRPPRVGEVQADLQKVGRASVVAAKVAGRFKEKKG